MQKHISNVFFVNFARFQKFQKNFSDPADVRRIAVFSYYFRSMYLHGQPQSVGNHGNELGVGGLAAVVLDGIAEVFI